MQKGFGQIMAKGKKLSTITDFTKNNWQDIGDKSANELRTQIQDKKFFSKVPYTAEYRKRKQNRKAAPKGVSVSSTSGTPDLTLTGKMMQSLRTTKATTKNASIGWTGAITNIVEGNKKNGRDVTTPKLLDKVGKVSRKQIEKVINKNIKRTKGTIKFPMKIKL